MAYHISLNEWLEFFGFASSPFSRWEAEEEAYHRPEQLSKLWVKPPCFDRVLGQAREPRTVLLFAPRGAGKTACRILVDYYCREGIGEGDRAETGGRVLPVPYLRLGEAARETAQTGRVADEYWHAHEIIGQSVQALVDFFRRDEDLVKRVHAMLPARRKDLQRFFDTYPPAAWEDVEFARDALEFDTAAQTDEQAVGTPEVAGEEDNEGECTAEVRPWLKSPAHRSPIDELARLVDLVCAGTPEKGLGFEAVYVLVDGLDEFAYSADLSTGRSVDIILPLIANLRLMNGIPRLAFKVFLPAETASAIRHHPAVRQDRLGYETIAWTDDGLKEILQRRLAAYGPIGELDMLCAPEIRGFAQVLIQAAGGNPRRMLRLCEAMLQAHLSRPLDQPADENGETAFLFTREDWEAAQRHIAQEDGPGIPLQAESQEEAPIASPTAVPHSSVLERYPSPIALVYLDYLRRQESFERLGRLLDLFEVTASFVGIVLLMQLFALAQDRIRAKLQAARLRLERPGLGTWLTVWERVPGLCNASGGGFYSRRLQSLFTRNQAVLDSLRVLRNETRGHGTTGSERAALEIIEQYEPSVLNILDSLGFLADTRLIQVKDMRMEQGLFAHRVRAFVGDNPNFPWEYVHLRKALECDKMLLLRGETDLSLHPLLLNTFCTECRQNTVFFYQKVEDQAVHYLAYSCGHRLVATELVQDVTQIVGE